MIVTVLCKLRGGCKGTVTLKQGSATVGKSAVKLRYGQRKEISIALRPRATIARVKRLRVKAPRGVRASL